MRWSFKISEPGTRYTPEAAEALVGQTPALNTRDTPDGPVTRDLGTGRVVAAKVVDDGAAILVTVESAATDLGLTP